MESKVGFLGGMDRDSSLSKRDPNKYYDAYNIRVLTDDGLSTGSVINEKGNSILFKMPESLGAIYTITSQVSAGDVIIETSSDTRTVSFSNYSYTGIYNAIMSDSDVLSDISLGYYNIILKDDLIYIIGLIDLVSVTTTLPLPVQLISATSGFKIIGIGTMRDWIVIFTTDTKTTPFDVPQSTVGNGQIWKCKYNPVSGIEDLVTGGFLNPSKHLVYNNVLGFSIGNRVGEIISRYQDESNAKVFFIDGINTLKHVNILDPNSLILPVSNIDTAPNVAFSQPKVKEVIRGGELRAGTIQYSYQLFNEDGVETSFAPASGMAHLTDYDEYESTNNEYKGNKADSTVNKSVVVSINNIDTSFDYIRLISIYYPSQEGAPEINILSEKRVPFNGSIEFIDTGNIIGVYASIQYNSTGNRVMIPNTITTKNGYLVAANIKEEYFDVDSESYWDSRAYRWINELGNIHFRIDDTDYDTYSDVSVEADCINPRASQETYKYNQGISALGGSGLNISYEFKLVPLKIDSDIDNLKTYTDKDSTYQAWGSKLGSSFADNGSYTSYASPINRQQLVGYTRNEIYRFGIVFFDGKGRQSFAKWIADVKMPSINATDIKNTYRVNNVNKQDYNTVFYQTIDGGTDLAGNVLEKGIYANVLGIEFTVDNIPEGTSYKIVRVRREQNDKYILGQGLMGVTRIVDSSNIEAYDHLYYEGLLGVHYGENIRSYLDSDSYKYIITLKSPEVLFTDSIKPVSGDNVKIVALTDVVSDEMAFDVLPTYQQIKVAKIKSLTTYNGYVAEVTDGTKVTDTFVDNADYRYVINNEGSIKRLINHNHAWKGSSLAIGLKENFVSSTPLGELTDSLHYAILNYTKDPSIVQYGGNTYTSRVNNIYISCGNLSSSNTSLVFGGDTYIGMFEYLNAMTYTGHGDTGDVEDNELMQVVFIPLESTINVELTNGTSYNKDSADYRLCETVAFGEKAAVFGGAGFGIYPANYTDMYQYNLAYSAEPIGKTFTVKPQFFKNNQINDYRIIVSEKHINNQLVDNWTKFLYNNLIEVNSAYGSINKIITFRNRLFFFQDNAFGIVGFEDKQLLKDNTGLQLVLGTGGILTNFQYISEKTGSKSKFGIIDTGSYLYFMDLNNRKFMRFDGNTDQCISDKDNLSSYFRTFNYGDILTSDSTSNGVGIHGVFDPVNKRVLYTMLGDDSSTFSFNEVLDNFESFYSFKPTIYENTDFGVISVNPNNLGQCYLHNSGNRGVFYGTAYDSYVTHIVAPNPDIKKVFNNIEFNSYVQVSGVDIPDRTINSINLSNSFQSTGDITLIEPTNIRRRFRTWRYQLPRVSSLRMMDYFLTVKTSFINSVSEDTYFRLDDIIIHYLVPMI